MKVGSKRRLTLRAGLCAALVSGLVVSGGSSALADCETVWVEVYDVQVDVGRSKYHLGDTVVVDATVTRSDSGAPVADAEFVAVATGARKGWVFGWNRTDAQGHATARMKLKKDQVKPGPMDLRAVAFEETADAASCAQVYEYGEKKVKKAFVVKP